MLYVKKNHGSFVFLIEFVKEVIAINISTQPYFPHNIFQYQVYMRKGVRLQDYYSNRIKMGSSKFKWCAHCCIHEKNLWVLQKYYLIRFNNFSMKRGGRVLNNF